MRLITPCFPGNHMLRRDKKDTDKDDDIKLPTPWPVINEINYLRAWQILKKTPFKELWVVAKKEAPGLLAALLFIVACLFSLCFTVCWFIKKTLVLLYSAVRYLISLMKRPIKTRKGGMND